MKRQARVGARKNRQQPSNLRERVDPVMCLAYKAASAEAHGTGEISLEQAMKMWPTKMGSGNGGQLNPRWVEWLMGWPIGWASLERLETDRFRQWLNSFGICYLKIQTLTEEKQMDRINACSVKFVYVCRYAMIDGEFRNCYWNRFRDHDWDSCGWAEEIGDYEHVCTNPQAQANALLRKFNDEEEKTE
jgi:hypothetical protein